jgi:esterase/lipase superfamily enzyme
MAVTCCSALTVIVVFLMMVKKINILAHSRGTDVVSTALREMIIASLAAKEDPLKTLKIAHMVLAAPDIDHKVASVQLTSDRTFEGIGHTTIYVSPHDKAIGLSQWIFGGLLRIGDMSVDDLTEVQKKNMAVRQNVNVIDAKIKPMGAGHSYYRSSPAVSSDIIQVIRYNYRPETPNERPLTELIPGFWSLGDDYLLDRTPPAKKSSK